MLQVIHEKERRIKEVKKKSDGLYLISDYGILRLCPIHSFTLRVSFTVQNHFEKNEGIGVVEQGICCDWSYHEDEEKIILNTEDMMVEVKRSTGSIKYYDRNGQLLLSERERESRELEEFDSYLVDSDSDLQVEEIDTPDGKKKRIKHGNLKYDRMLYRTRWYVDWQEDELLYGLGQTQEGVLNLRGTTQFLHQANMKIAIPVLLSTAGYGVLFATGSPSIFHDNEDGSYFYTEADRYMDLYIIVGENFDRIIHGVRLMTGKATMLPLWTFGYLQSQERYENQQEILEVVKEYRRRNLGLDCIVLDWCSWKGDLWGQKTLDEGRFPEPNQLMEQLHEQNVHFMISIWPNMSEKCDNYREFRENNLLLPASNVYNAFDSKARKIYWKQLKEGLFQYGIDAFWCDSSEPFTPEWNHVMKPEASRMYVEYYEESSKHIPAWCCNSYGLVHAQGVYEGQRSETEEKRVVNLTRSTYLGGQRYGVITWSGDISASWTSYRNQIIAGLNYCVTGLPYWTIDIGGFFVKKGVQWFWNGDYNQGIEDTGYKELYVRWFQFATFLPIFRAHGTDVRRELWAFGEKHDMFYDALVESNSLRYRLLPYIYSCAGEVWYSDASMMRMLAFDFKTDRIACQIKDQYLFGKSIMVCPITEPMYYDIDSKKISKSQYRRKVYLPKSEIWYDFWTNTPYEGGQWLEIEAPLHRIPLFIRSGSILPICNNLCSSKELKDCELTLHIYGENATTTIYEDDKDGYGYEKGEYCITKLKWDNQKKLQVEVIDGRYKGRDYSTCNIIEVC